MIFWCRDQDLFCAAWYEIHEVKTKIIQVQGNLNFQRNYHGICFVPRGMTLMMRKPGLEIISCMN